MNLDINIITADATHSGSIKRIISDIYEPVMKSNIKKFGPEISKGLDKRWQMSDYSTVSSKNEILVAVVDKRVVGFTAYRVVNDILITDCAMTDTEYKTDEVSGALYSATLKKAKEIGCKYAKVHTVLDEAYSHVYGNYKEAGYKSRLESVMYYMPLSQRTQNRINNNVVIVPASDMHVEDVMKITVSAWTPIRLEQKRLLGDTLYKRFFDGWEERKCLEVKDDFLASGKDGTFGYTALMDGKVAGFVTRLRSTSVPYMGIIGNNAVDPAYSGKGIGGAMHSYIIGEMEKEGMTHVGVFTGCDYAHAPARRAYETVGFDIESAVICADNYVFIE